MGITRVANITGLDTINIPVYIAHRPNARSISVAQGKGSTHAAAKTSALMEAVETWHAETIELPLRLNSHMELEHKNNIIDVSRLPQFKEHTFSPHARILWIEGDDLLSGKKKLVPYEMVHLDYRLPFPNGHGCFVPSSSGLASGNHILEAVIHGACELIERDALTLWYLKPPSQQKMDKVNPDTVTDRRCADVMKLFHQADIHVGIWDMTSDTGIPAFLCRLLPKTTSDISNIRPASGMGCHLSRDIALLRALTEAAQSRLAFISGARDDLDRAGYKKFLTAIEYAKWHESIIGRENLKDFHSIASFETDGLEKDKDFVLERLQKTGINEVISIDLTKPEFGIPVARMVIPGLEATLVQADMLLGQRAGRIMGTEKQA
jgi:ribosomal protein S12 methylthiotransferase accessory factor